MSLETHGGKRERSGRKVRPHPLLIPPFRLPKLMIDFVQENGGASYLRELVYRDMRKQDKVIISIPETVSFADLKLDRRANGDVSFDWAPIEKICVASGIDVAILKRSHEDNLADLLTRWYHAHLKNGGAHDPVFEEVFAEAISELN